LNKSCVAFIFFLLSTNLFASQADRLGYEIVKLYKSFRSQNLDPDFSALSKSKFPDELKPFQQLGLKLKKLNKLHRDIVFKKCVEINETHEAKDDLLLNIFVRKASKFCFENWSDKVAKSKIPSLSYMEIAYFENNLDLFFNFDDKFIETLLENDKKLTLHLSKASLKSPQTLKYFKLIPQEDLSLEQISLYHSMSNAQEINIPNSFFSYIRRDISAFADPENSDVSYFEFLNDYISSNNFDDAQLDLLNFEGLVRTYISQGSTEKVRSIFEILQNSKTLFVRNAALQSLIWIHVFNEDNHKSQEIVSKFNFNDMKTDPQLCFWGGYLLNKIGLRQNSSVYFEYLAENHPLSFYGVLSSKLMNKFLSTNAPARELASSETEDQQLNTYLKRIQIWDSVDYPLFKEIDIRTLSNSISTLTPGSPQFDARFYPVINTLKDLGDYLSIFKIYYEFNSSHGMKISSSDLNFLFPNVFVDHIEKNTSQLPSNFVLSIMRQESAFNPRSVSSAGAVGLLQLLPSTAKQHVSFRRPSALYEPVLNVKAGVRFLERLSRKFDGDIVKVLSSYNAGEGNVKRWIKGHLSQEEPLLAIEMIPFKETRNYVKLIYRNYFYYNLLANNDKFLAADFNKNLDLNFNN